MGYLNTLAQILDVDIRQPNIKEDLSFCLMCTIENLNYSTKEECLQSMKSIKTSLKYLEESIENNNTNNVKNVITQEVINDKLSLIKQEKHITK
jgi:hypothetical protein